MLVGVADTHAVLWYLHAAPRLSPTAKAFIDAAAARGDVQRHFEAGAGGA